MSAAAEVATDSWESFFDDDYARLWSDTITDDETQSQCEALWKLLELRQGSRVLDAGCGYGRLARPLAERGAIVVGVDRSAALLAHAERNRGVLPESSLRYVRHDLRHRLSEAGFDAAFNAFTGIGYGSEAEDAAIIATLYDAVRPDGFVLMDVIQRDAVAAYLATGAKLARRRPDGILVITETSYDAFAARLTGTWYWAGSGTSGQKTLSMHIYTVGELIHLTERAGFELRGTYLSISTTPFKAEPPQMGGRIGLLLQRPE